MSNLKRRAAALLASLLVVGLGVFALQTPATAGPLPYLYGPYTIRPAANVGQCLDVVNNSYADGARLQTYQCLGSQQYNQIFYFWKVEGTTSYYRITPSSSWKCLDVQGGPSNVADYAPLQTYTCLGATQYNQIFDVWEYGTIDHSNAITPTHSWKGLSYERASNGGAVYQCNVCTGNNWWYFFPA